MKSASHSSTSKSETKDKMVGSYYWIILEFGVKNFRYFPMLGEMIKKSIFAYKPARQFRDPFLVSFSLVPDPLESTPFKWTIQMVTMVKMESMRRTSCLANPHF
jgi:hypothetical protein